MSACVCAAGESRTLMRLPPQDFESCASASSATAALLYSISFSTFFQEKQLFVIHIVCICKVWYYVYMANIFGELNALLGGGGEDKEVEIQPLQDQSSDVVSPTTLAQPANGNNVGSFLEPPRNDARSVSERPKESVFWIEIAKIKPNPEQPRTTFDENKIRALAESIRQYGILQPIVVSKREIDVPTGTQVEYQIIAGERRFRAAQMIGLVHMPAVIRREDSDRIKLELALIENLQREDLQPLEKAHAYKRLVKEFGLSAADVGFRVGKSRESVANTMRLLMLPEYVQQALVAGTVLEGQVRPLISLAHSPEEQRLLFERVVRDGLGARDVEEAARQVAGKMGIVLRPIRKAMVDKGTHDAATRLYETKLADALGTRVSVKRTRDGKGKISIEFFSNEELQNLLGRMAALQEEEGRGIDNDANNVSEGGGTVVIHPLHPPVGGAEQSEGAARPEDLSTFTV